VADRCDSRRRQNVGRARWGEHVPQYWIVDLDARLVERWTPPDERPEVLTDQVTWHPAGAAEPFDLDLQRYFARIFDEE
jgi:hypothetical protein